MFQRSCIGNEKGRLTLALKMLGSIALNRQIFHFEPIGSDAANVVNACVLIRAPNCEVVEVSWVHDDGIQADYS